METNPCRRPFLHVVIILKRGSFWVSFLFFILCVATRFIMLYIYPQQNKINKKSKMSLLNERLKQPEFENPAHEAMLSLLVTANGLKEKHNEICGENGISYQHFNILPILKGVFPKGHPRCEISTRMIDRSPDITRLINKLVKEGLVKRTKPVEDMRQSVAVITQKGIELLNELNEGMRDLAKQFEQAVGEEEINKIISICERILKLQ